MIVPEVKGYGGFEKESFDDYYSRWPAKLSNFPKCVVEHWVYRHWQDFKNLWLDRCIEKLAFDLAHYSNSQIMEVGHIGDRMQTMDYWGDELFRNKQRQNTWLAQYMLANGTSPVPIIVAPNASGLEHPRGGSMHELQLIEGHMRLSYLRGMIRHRHPTLKEAHEVWCVSLPNIAFRPMARTKATSGVREYYAALQRIFELESEVLTAVLPHMGERGRNDEERFRNFLSKTLPRRFSIGTGFVVCGEPAVPRSDQTDVVIFDEVYNSPLHRELAAFVYPIEMVYATVEVKGTLKSAHLRGSLRSIAKIRRLAKHKRYAIPVSVPVGSSHPGKTALRQLEVKDELPPRGYVFAYDADGWANVDTFAESWRTALASNGSAHIHGVVVLKKNWFIYQMAYTREPDVRKHSDNALLRFNTKLVRDISGMQMASVSSTRYLQLDAEPNANQPLNRTARKRAAG